MTVRAVEWKKPYTWGTAITVDENKVISLNLRDENNLIIYDAGDDEIYVDLQLPDEITPTDAFPVWVTTGRVIVDNGWDANGTLICAKTTSGDNIKILYEDNWTLRIDNGTWTFKQIYFKSDVDGIITTLTTYINWELAKKQNWVTSDTAPSNPSEWDLWYDTVNDALKVYDGTNWVATGTGWSWDVVVSTDTGNELSTGVGLWLGTETDFSSISTPDTNTLYIQYKSDWGGGWQPWVNTIAYWKMDWDLTDEMGSYDGTAKSSTTITYEALPWDSNVQCVKVTSSSFSGWISLPTSIYSEFMTQQTNFTFWGFMKRTGLYTYLLYLEDSSNHTVNISCDNQSHLPWGWWLYLEMSWQSESQLTGSYADGSWHSILWAYDHTTRVKSFYVDWQLAGTVTATTDYTTFGSASIAALARINNNLCMSNMVFETNVAWTQQEADLFHNTFKSLYWIS